MKWTKKGHEFDLIGERLSKVDKIYLYGAGHIGAYVLDRLSFLSVSISFIDRNINKQKKGYKGKSVISPSNFLRDEAGRKNSIVIITMNEYRQVKQVKKILMCHDYVEGINLFEHDHFLGSYLPIFLLYKDRKLYSPHVYIYLTDKCTLKCRHCCNDIPYLEERKHRVYQDIISIIDSIFSTYDCAYRIALIGGEAILHPRFADIADYILENYSSRFQILTVITNGYTDYSYFERSMKILKNPNVLVEVSDYRKVLDDMKALQITNNIDQLKAEGVKVSIWNIDHWVYLGRGERLDYCDDAMIAHYHDCEGRCVRMDSDGVFACGLAARFTMRLFGRKPDAVPYVADECNKERHKHIHLETHYGYTENDYPEGCRYCKGHFGANNDKVIPGEQVKGIR